MPGVKLYYELVGAGEPLALVHGSWADATSWRLVLPGLAERFRVLTYDRRGHSRSERANTQGSFDEDGDDLAALLEALDLAPAHVATISSGGNIALRLATRRQGLFRSVYCHEPSLWSVLADDVEAQQILAEGVRTIGLIAERIAEGDHEGAARQFVDEVIMGPGAWEEALPAEARAAMVENAPAFLDELQDPNYTILDESAFALLEKPVLLTSGTESPPVCERLCDRLAELAPGATSRALDGAGHLPQLTIPERYVEATTLAATRASV